MANRLVGRNGAAVLLVVFALLVVEDVLIWINRGVVPGVEFFVASVIVVLVLAVVVRESLRHPPGDQ